MERIKAPVSRIKTESVKSPVRRVKADKTPTESAPIERIKPTATRIYNGGMIKDPKTKMFWKDGEFYRLIDGCYFKAWPDGHLKDQKTATHVCWFRKITRKATVEDEKRASLAIQKCMIRCFPEMFYDMETGERISHQVDEDGQMIYKRTYV